MDWITDLHIMFPIPWGTLADLSWWFSRTSAVMSRCACLPKIVVFPFSGNAMCKPCFIHFYIVRTALQHHSLQGNQLVNLFTSFFHTNSLMVRGYEPGREDHEFDPRLENFFFNISILCGYEPHIKGF